jgi:cytochrome c peroxidase
MVVGGIGAAGCLVIVLAAQAALPGDQSDRTYSRAAWKVQYQRPVAIPYPEGNPHSEAKSRLGRTLFFDPILSGPQTKSCASCHNPTLSWQDGLPRALGIEKLPIRTPTLLNVAWVPKLGWDGHFRNLEALTFGPISSPKNMDLPKDEAVKRLSAIPGYVKLFNEAFGPGPVTPRKIELALATFERSIVSDEAPFDRWIKGDERAISEAAKRGFDVFNTKGNCAACHMGWAFTDASFHDIGTARGADLGRGQLFPTSVSLRYAFKTPTLRDVARRAPYMHDGSVATLGFVIDLYDKGGIDRPSRAKDIRPLNLTTEEKADLIAFMETLTGVQEPIAIPRAPR